MIVREEIIKARPAGQNGHGSAEAFEASLGVSAPRVLSHGELEAEAEFWHVRYEEERERLAKLWVAYEDLEFELEELKEARQALPVAEPVAVKMAAAKLEPFRFGPFTLYERDVKLKNGDPVKIHFFAKAKPKSGEAVAMPDGFEIDAHAASGLPFLRRIGARGPRRAEHAHAYRPQCGALTDGGGQCRNSARHGSRYCASHVGYHPPTVQGFLNKLDTAPRGVAASDTKPVATSRKQIVSVGGKNGHGNGSGEGTPQCSAFTAEGDQCRNLARTESKYCASHRGYRPPTVETLLRVRDTKPRVHGAEDTKPALRT